MVWHQSIRHIGSSTVTEHASDDQRLGSLDDTILIAKLSIQSKELTRVRSELLDGEFFLLL